jgi:hypothetical protein
MDRSLPLSVVGLPTFTVVDYPLDRLVHTNP